MKSVLLPLILFLFISNTIQAQQKAKIQNTVQAITTYPFSDPDPIPRPGRIYPYFRFDGYTNDSRKQNWKMVELENDYIRLAITPEIGGKIWSAYERSKEFPFIFSNHVVKFRDVAMRGAWTSGGIEFNFGDYGHAPTTSSPVDYYTRTNSDGSVSCFIGATDWSSRTTWRVEINLQPDKAYFTTRSWWHNGTPLEQSYYHWTNAGFRALGNLEYIYPGTHYIGHQGEYDTFPVDSLGRKISFYEQNNFGSYKSYHVVGRPTDFYGGYWHDYNMGVGHWAPYHEKLGKKAWSWGLSREGLLWEGLLTDTDGPNVELQSGRLFNQASPKSMYSPFKHVAFAPYTVDSWKEYWFPVKQTRGMTHATTQGALNLRIENSWLKLDWMALEKQTDTLAIKANGTTIFSRKLSLLPMQVLRDSVKWKGDVEKLVVTIGDEFVTNDSDGPLNRPLEAPQDFDWTSEYGLFFRGRDLSNQRNYTEAEIYLSEALKVNPNLLPALTQMAQIRYRQGLYDQAREFARRALSINTYDADANYMWGLSSVSLNNMADALDGFSVAALNSAYRSAAMLRIGYLSMTKNNWKKSETIIRECLMINPESSDAQNALAIILRKQGQSNAAQDYIQQLLYDNPLNHFARFEIYLLDRNEKTRREFVEMIRQELPHETFLEIAIQYYKWNLFQEAEEVLALAPHQPIVQLWQAFILEKLGETSASDKALEEALSMSAEFVFPFRPETLEPLRWANQRKGHWKWNYFEGLLRWQNNQPDAAKKLFQDCGITPDFAPFYLAKAELFKENPIEAGSALEKAYQLDPASWRTGSKLAQFYAKEKQVTEAVGIAEKNYKTHPSSYIVGLQYAQMLVLNKQYPAALNVLNKLAMLPAEHALDAPRLFRQANILYAIENMKGRKWKIAAQYLQKAETWPENLGAGQPYNPDNRITQFMLAYCYENQGNKDLSEKAFDYIRTYENRDKSELDPAGNTLTEFAKQNVRNYKVIIGRILENPDSEYYFNEFLNILK